MRTKIIAVLIIAGTSAAFFAVMHSDNRADAASGNCYSDAQGPSTPMICN